MTVVVEFVGLPGVGKSSLCREVASELDTREIPISEPTRNIELKPNAIRILLKARFAVTSYLNRPQTGLATIRAVLDSDQKSIFDSIRVLFNLHYITGLLTTHSSGSVHLLDQGLYQALWSIGLRSSQDWAAIFDTFSKLLPIPPNLVVFVEADNNTIVDRLGNRTDGNTRFEPGTKNFERARAGYDALKSLVQDSTDGPKSLVVKNENPRDLNTNAVCIADTVLSVKNDLLT